jgi:hypothetical protein
LEALECENKINDLQINGENTLDCAMEIIELQERMEEIEKAEYSNMSFSITLSRNVRRTLNKNASHDKCFNPDTQTYEYYGPRTEERLKTFNETFTGSKYTSSRGKRSRYKRMFMVDLSAERLVAQGKKDLEDIPETEEFEEDWMMEDLGGLDPDWGDE